MANDGFLNKAFGIRTPEEKTQHDVDVWMQNPEKLEFWQRPENKAYYKRRYGIDLDQYLPKSSATMQFEQQYTPKGQNIFRQQGIAPTEAIRTGLPRTGSATVTPAESGAPSFFQAPGGKELKAEEQAKRAALQGDFGPAESLARVKQILSPAKEKAPEGASLLRSSDPTERGIYDIGQILSSGGTLTSEQKRFRQEQKTGKPKKEKVDKEEQRYKKMDKLDDWQLMSKLRFEYKDLDIASLTQMVKDYRIMRSAPSEPGVEEQLQQAMHNWTFLTGNPPPVSAGQQPTKEEELDILFR